MMRTIPPITKNLLIINIICFLAGIVLEGRGIDLNNVFGLHYMQAADFAFYQPLTYMFMHASFTHLLFNMFALWMFGSVIERTFGERRFLIYYMVCGLGAALCQELSQAVMIYSRLTETGGSLSYMINDLNLPVSPTTVGASGSIYGILLAFGMCFPEEKMFIFPLPVPIKAKWFISFYIVIELLLALFSRGDGVAHVAHLGGMIFGYLLIRSWRRGTRSRFNGWDGYEIKEKSPTILGRIRRWLHLDKDANTGPHHGYGEGATAKNRKDWDYNAEKKQRDKETDDILDKIRRSGYESLTDEEKRKLFDKR